MEPAGTDVLSQQIATLETRSLAMEARLQAMDDKLDAMANKQCGCAVM